jgi:hypothetical protein
MHLVLQAGGQCRFQCGHPILNTLHVCRLGEFVLSLLCFVVEWFFTGFLSLWISYCQRFVSWTEDCTLCGIGIMDL